MAIFEASTAEQLQWIHNRFLVRPVQPEDNPAIAQIIRDVMVEFNFGKPDPHMFDPEIDHIYETYNQPGRCFWVVFDQDLQNTLIGGCGIGRLPGTSQADGICELQNMYFAQQYRRFGVGKELILIAMEKARSLGYTQLYAESQERFGGRGILHHFDFKPLPQALGSNNNPDNDLFMIKQL